MRGEVVVFWMVVFEAYFFATFWRFIFPQGLNGVDTATDRRWALPMKCVDSSLRSE
jgi:hypothetical protein